MLYSYGILSISSGSSSLRVKTLSRRGEGGVGARFIAPWAGPLWPPTVSLNAGEPVQIDIRVGIESQRGSAMPTRIIIADDETIQRMDLKDILTKQGYLVVGEAGDGVSAVNLAREIRPDLVIMDIRMPDMDGITAAETLTQEKIAPVLLLTAFGDQPLVERAREAGVVHYIVKPLRESQVAPAIEIALARYQEFRELEEKTRNLTEQLETRKIVERAKGVLMEKQGLTEQEAFRKIQKASMNNRKSMREVAEAILLANEM